LLESQAGEVLAVGDKAAADDPYFELFHCVVCPFWISRLFRQKLGKITRVNFLSKKEPFSLVLVYN
jgi:hypothetical protein